MFYTFEYDEIMCCYECPFFYDYIYCELEPLHTEEGWHLDYTDRDDNKRPDWCKLKERKERKVLR